MKLKILTIIISLLTLIFLGLIYAWSIFVVPLENEFGWSRSETSLTFTISIMAFCLSMMFGGFFNGKKDKPLISLIIAAVLIAAGFVMTSRAGSLLGFYICYGVCCGAGVGFSYVEIISVISKWFPARQGLMSGTMMMAYGMGAMILGPICTALMGSIGWRSVFVLLGVIMSLLLALSGILMQTANALTPAAKASDPGLDPALNETSSEQRSPQIPSNDKSPAQAVRTLEFWILFFFCMVLSASGLALMGHIAPCVMGMGVSAQSAALIAGITSFANHFPAGYHRDRCRHPDGDPAGADRRLLPAGPELRRSAADQFNCRCPHLREQILLSELRTQQLPAHLRSFPRSVSGRCRLYGYRLLRHYLQLLYPLRRPRCHFRPHHGQKGFRLMCRPE